MAHFIFWEGFVCGDVICRNLFARMYIIKIARDLIYPKEEIHAFVHHVCMIFLSLPFFIFRASFSWSTTTNRPYLYVKGPLQLKISSVLLQKNSKKILDHTQEKKLAKGLLDTFSKTCITWRVHQAKKKVKIIMWENSRNLRRPCVRYIMIIISSILSGTLCLDVDRRFISVPRNRKVIKMVFMFRYHENILVVTPFYSPFLAIFLSLLSFMLFSCHEDDVALSHIVLGEVCAKVFRSPSEFSYNLQNVKNKGKIAEAGPSLTLHIYMCGWTSSVILMFYMYDSFQQLLTCFVLFHFCAGSGNASLATFFHNDDMYYAS